MTAIPGDIVVDNGIHFFVYFEENDTLYCKPMSNHDLFGYFDGEYFLITHKNYSIVTPVF